MADGMIYKTSQEAEQMKRETEDKGSVGMSPVTGEKQPMVLVGGPITEYKIYCTAQFMTGIKKMSYKNKVIVLVDNSPTDAIREAISRLKIDCPFYILTTPNRAYARQRLVEGRNLLRDIMLKKKDLSSYELSVEDEKKTRELQEMDFDYFFSIEQDVVPPIDVVEQLLGNEKDIIEAVYFNSKKLPNNSITIIPMAWNWADPQVKELELLIDCPMEFLLPSRIFSVAAIGLGCCLMKKEVLERMENVTNVLDKFNKVDGKTEEELKKQIEGKLQGITDELKICTPGADIQIDYKNIEVNGIGISVPSKIISKGFRYDKSKYACDDMFFSLDTSKMGYDLYINSYLWCNHYHQQWDIQQVGER